MNRYVTYLFMGAPGSGKGTQGKALGAVPRFFHCACGEVFRSLDLRTPLGQKFVEYSCKGLLVPDDLTVELWRTKIEAQVLEAEFKPDIDALVLDGIPRNVNQAKLMENLIDVRRVFHLSCPNRNELVRRLRKRAIKDNRLDDASEEFASHCKVGSPISPLPMNTTRGLLLIVLKLARSGSARRSSNSLLPPVKR